MKNIKVFFIIILLLISMLSFAQINEEDKELTFNFNGYKTASSNGMFPVGEISTVVTFNPILEFNYYMSEKFYFGIGAEYFRSKDEDQNSILLDSFYQETSSEILSNSIIPFIKLGYNIQILNNLYLKSNLSFNYGFNYIKGNSLYQGIKITSIADFYSLTNNTGGVISEEFESNQDFQHYGVSFYPEFQYYLKKSFAFNLRVGNIEYARIINGDEGIWSFAFNPIFWKLGISFKF